jgi:hypothetical protein
MTSKLAILHLSLYIHKRNLYLSNQDILVGITEDTDKNSSYDSTITSMYVEYGVAVGTKGCTVEQLLGSLQSESICWSSQC